MSIVNLVLLAGAAQGLLLSALLIVLRSSNPLANRFLAAFVGIESLHLFWLFLAYSNLVVLPLPPMALLFNLRILAGPALFLYVCAMTAREFRLHARHVLHLLVVLPPLVWSLFLIGQQDATISAGPREIQLRPGTVGLAFYASLIFVAYGIAALRQLHRHNWRLEQTLSSIEEISLWWLRAAIGLVVAANLLGLILDVMRLQQVIAEDPRIWINLATTLLVIYLISLGGLRQPEIFTRPVNEALAALDRNGDQDDERHGEREDKEPVAPEISGKYRKSGLSGERIQALWRRLHEILGEQELYRNPSLDLPALARALGVRPQELSQVISTSGGGSFYDLINDYRVEAARQLLADTDARKRKLFDIALTAGFSSQSTFYSQFKKRTGKTPNAFRTESAR